VETTVIEMGCSSLLKINDKSDELSELNVTDMAVDELDDLVVERGRLAW
jgi:hypothetical protein